ncbi:alpha/beta hydrolase [Propioniciclava coleopterorum]|uniref:Alpha/beta hydrolase n=1 Tax=Propioniciclava coleopterorum TaxID=2714937 RepID=A0A6G7Y7Y1_9ACTN|nr:alpha/beta hydrolase [Propioniciclava coleopterorum]QIK72758.1 alpha/beta hydrolase [Propioniciclava coleopterorum]
MTTLQDAAGTDRPHPQRWRPDPLEGFEHRDLPLTAQPLPGESLDPLVGTLIRRSDPELRRSARAVLHVHGWNDYFFHPHVAEFYEAQGYAFYALDLRRYGRSLRAGQFHGYIDDLDDYREEIDGAVAAIRREHSHLVLTGHSTGGLITTLWAGDRPGRIDALVLNSPWLDMWGPVGIGSLMRPIVGPIGKRNPTSPLKMPEGEEPIYAMATHVDFGGEWNYSLDWKSAGSEVVRLGWVRAILNGHARVARGLPIDCPVLVTISARTAFLRRYSEEARTADVVLNVDRIAAASWHLGDAVTLIRIEGGMHDLSLSLPEPRQRWFDAVATWLHAYGPSA